MKIDDRPLFGGTQDMFYSLSHDVPLPLIVKAKGVYLFDNQGNQYIDASSGPVVSNIGHGNYRVAQAMAKQACDMDFAYPRVARHQPNFDLANRITTHAGSGFERICFSSGGSEAMEIALKFLRQYAVTKGQKNKRHVITCNPSYHGGTIATLSITGDETLETFLDGFSIPSTKVPAPFTYRIPKGYTVDSYALYCADQLERSIQYLGPDEVLSFCVEPIGGLATGCNVLPDIYVKTVRKICNQYKVPMIFDEILCGTGRTGKFLAAHHWPDSLPDIVVMAKGLGSGYTPIGATLFPSLMVDELTQTTGLNFSHTYNANPIACATCLAVMDEYDRLNLIEKARIDGQYLREQLQVLADNSKVIGNIRGLGMLYGIEIVSDKSSKQSFSGNIWPTEIMRKIGLKHGLFIYTRRTANGYYGDWIMIAPPLTISRSEINELIEKLSRAFEDFESVYLL